jgi:hypothetical protein
VVEVVRVEELRVLLERQILETELGVQTLGRELKDLEQLEALE